MSKLLLNIDDATRVAMRFLRQYVDRFDPDELEDIVHSEMEQKSYIMQTQDFYGHTMKEWYIKYCLYDWDVWDEDADGKIVAWMPLPEPYKGKGGEEG